jgi:hypothetical protein
VPKTYNGEKTASSTNVAGELGISICRKLKLNLCLLPCTSINSKWIKDLDIRPKTLELVQERGGSTLELIDTGNNFLSRTQMANQLREKTDKEDLMKLKSLYTTQKWTPG